jgi:translation initiation factor RLI1
MDYSLSNKDIYHFLGGNVKILTNTDIKKYKSIQELLSPYNQVVILYRNSMNYGHWTCLFKNKYGINFFDSYGNMPDEILRFVPKHLNIQLKQDHQNLIKLLLKSKKPVFYNQYPLQKYSDLINTCGRWVVFRLMNKELNEDEFNKLFHSSKYSKDEIITKITDNL